MINRSSLIELLAHPASFEVHGLVAVRGDDGRVRANVPHVVWHSPDGFELGYQGSGPADLALSALHALLPPSLTPQEQAEALSLQPQQLLQLVADPLLWSGPVGPRRVHVSVLAMDLHQEFKRDFLASADATDGVQVARDVMTAWVRRKTNPSHVDVGGVS